jgi:RNA polymerase sigma factor (sigma-70 family)
MARRCGKSTLETLQALRDRIIKLGGWRDGEDVFQDVCVGVLTGSKATRSLPGLIMRIARSRLCDMWRQRGRHPQCPLDAVPEPSSWDENPQVNLERRESEELLERALGKLSPCNRTAFLAKYLQHQKDQQAADELGITLETFRTRYKRARNQLKRLLCPPEALPLHPDFAIPPRAQFDRLNNV